MKLSQLTPIAVVVGCAALSTLADTMGTLYWERRSLPHLLFTIVIAPFVFILFGWVGASQGLATASGYTNSLIVAGPILVGLLFRRELAQVSVAQVIGLLFIFVGIGLVALTRRPA